MTLEADLMTVLTPVCERGSPDVASMSTTMPFWTYQAIGGRSLRWLDSSASDKRHTLLQINVWGATRTGVNALAREIEDAMCAATVFKAWPDAEPISTHDDLPLPDAPDGVFGTIQDFNVYSTR